MKLRRWIAIAMALMLVLGMLPMQEQPRGALKQNKQKKGGASA